MQNADMPQPCLTDLDTRIGSSCLSDPITSKLHEARPGATEADRRARRDKVDRAAAAYHSLPDLG